MTIRLRDNCGICAQRRVSVGRGPVEQQRVRVGAHDYVNFWGQALRHPPLYAKHRDKSYVCFM